MPKKVLIALPPAMLLEVDMIATKEHRNRSDLIRESLRRYIESYKRNSVEYSHVPLNRSHEETTPWVKKELVAAE